MNYRIINRNKIYLLVAFIATLMLILPTSCKRKSNQGTNRPSAMEAKEMLMRINKTLNIEDKEKIETYINEKSIEGINSSKTGLYYKIWGESNDKQVETNDIVEISYTISLLDGTTCYKSETDGLKTFKVGQGGVESGLEEGVLLMKQGQKALFILPPHLAHGLIGDGKNIPARQIIVYNVEILNVKH